MLYSTLPRNHWEALSSLSSPGLQQLIHLATFSLSNANAPFLSYSLKSSGFHKKVPSPAISLALHYAPNQKIDYFTSWKEKERKIIKERANTDCFVSLEAWTVKNLWSAGHCAKLFSFFLLFRSAQQTNSEKNPAAPSTTVLLLITQVIGKHQ